MQRHRFGRRALYILLHRAVGGVQRIRLGRQRQIDHRLRQRQIALRHADEIHGIACRHAHRERIRIGQADVFHRHAHHAPRHVERIFAGFEHASQPIERRVGIAVAHRLVQRGNQVVVLFAGLVVEQHPLLQRILHDLVGNLRPHFFAGFPRASVAATSSTL